MYEMTRDDAEIRTQPCAKPCATMRETMRDHVRNNILEDVRTCLADGLQPTTLWSSLLDVGLATERGHLDMGGSVTSGCVCFKVVRRGIEFGHGCIISTAFLSSPIRMYRAWRELNV